MDATDLPEDLRRCIEFHGHYCGGLLTGYRAARTAMERLGSARAEDEELVAIVENDSCAADAVQVLTGCTFGKGNFIFRDHGKHVYTFALRPTGRAVRVSRRPRDEIAEPQAPENTSDEERREHHLRWVLNAPAEVLFTVEDTRVDLPPTAVIRDSVICQVCGEPVMETRTRQVDDRVLCRPCAGDADSPVGERDATDR